jgi:anti-sigma factor RsiW
MTQPMAGNGGHLENGHLIRLLDRECPPEEEARINRHLRDCVTCRQNAAELEHLSDRFRLALQHGDGAEGTAHTPAWSRGGTPSGRCSRKRLRRRPHGRSQRLTSPRRRRS